jgi:hypothetical protein
LYIEGVVSQTASFSTDFETITLVGYDNERGHHLSVQKKNYD